MFPISISQEKCRQCYGCVQNCPTNALKIDKRKVRLIASRCVLCGNCYKNCSHGAIVVHSGAEKVLKLLEKGDNVIACLDPTFPSVLDIGSPAQLVTALKKLGFKEVWESAFGGDLVINAYKKLTSQNKKKSWISSFCPSLVLYIEKFAPQLVDQLVPIVSPMIATGLAIKKLRGQKTKVVFVSSCFSRIWECQDPLVKGAVDYVLTYHDIPYILAKKGINREEQEPSAFDGPPAQQGRILGIAGGVSKSIGFDQDLLNLDLVVASGFRRAIRAIQQLQEGTIRPKFLDLLFCEGCIEGPIVDINISGPSRKKIVVDFIKSHQRKNLNITISELKKLKNLNLKRNFKTMDVSLPEPDEAKIQAVLIKMNKTYPDHNLDCGQCGYNTCREKAIAVVQGLAEMEMCPHYLLEKLRSLYFRLQKSHQQLKNSHAALEQAQKQLIQSEKMASIGQLAAGVAHELNNPLGTITLFAGFLQKELSNNKKYAKDLELIAKEAERAAKIVKDLLSFSRETKLRPGLVNINNIIEGALSLLLKQSIFYNIKVEKYLDPSLPNTFADENLLKQVIFNIVLNGAQAMDGRGILTIKSMALNNGRKMQIQISDTGWGIPKEYMSRLFDPFFTTKDKGTGLGLALAYGIVAKHKGKIEVESKVGQGTTFFINLPVLDQKQWQKRGKQLVAMPKIQRGKENESKSKNLIG